MKFYLSDKVTIISAISTLSISFWILDSMIDYIVFEQGTSLSDNLFFPSKMELWMRIIIVTQIALFLTFNKEFVSFLLINRYKHRHSNANLDLTRQLHEQRVVNMRLREQASTDPLTSLLNRRGFQRLFEHSMNSALAQQQRVCFVICDIDDFKKINDNYGHDVGDETLIALSKILSNSIYEPDFVVRWGGEEFIIALFDKDLFSAGEYSRRHQGHYFFSSLQRHRNN